MWRKIGNRLAGGFIVERKSAAVACNGMVWRNGDVAYLKAAGRRQNLVAYLRQQRQRAHGGAIISGVMAEKAINQHGGMRGVAGATPGATYRALRM